MTYRGWRNKSPYHSRDLGALDFFLIFLAVGLLVAPSDLVPQVGQRDVGTKLVCSPFHNAMKCKVAHKTMRLGSRP